MKHMLMEIDGGPKHLTTPERPKRFWGWRKYACALERYVGYLEDREWHRIQEIDAIYKHLGPIARRIVTELEPIANAWDRIGYRFPWDQRGPK